MTPQLQAWIEDNIDALKCAYRNYRDSVDYVDMIPMSFEEYAEDAYTYEVES